MTAYIARRIGEGLVTLIALSFVVFGSVHLTGDPARFLLPISAEHDESVYEAQKAAYGLDKPFIVQYWNFLIKAVRLDFGQSFTARRPVQEILLERIPATVHLAIAGTVLAIGIGVPLGIISAVKRDTLLDKICKAFAIFGMAAPQFWVAIMLIIVVCRLLGLVTRIRERGRDRVVPIMVADPRYAGALDIAGVCAGPGNHRRHHAPGPFRDAGSAGQRLRQVCPGQGHERPGGHLEARGA